MGGRPLIWRITETDADEVEARVTFTYDGLSRLVHEERDDDAETGAVEYEFTYVYDKLGNRMRKIDHVKDFTTVYHYDVHEPAQGQDPDPFAAHNNRLQWYDVYAGEFGCEDGDPNDCDAPTGSPLERVMYVYNKAGDPDVIAHYRPGSSDTVFLVRFTYDTGGRVFNVEQWTYELEGTAPDYEIVEDSDQRVGFREFRYDGGGRGRYLVRVREPDLDSQDVGQVLSAFWTDYDGDAPYADYTVDGSTVVEKIAYLAGVSQTVLADALGPDNPEDPTTVYFHADQVGTSRALSDGGTAIASPAAPVARRVYSAFGEPVFESAGEGYAQTRYGYVGEYGYKEGLLDPWGGQFTTYGDPDEAGTAPRLNYIHVGARWYDPSTGRFLQRDPIGLNGGQNVYNYVEGSPTGAIDPTGNDRWGGKPDDWHIYVIVGNDEIGYHEVHFAAMGWNQGGGSCNSCIGILSLLSGGPGQYTVVPHPRRPAGPPDTKTTS